MTLKRPITFLAGVAVLLLASLAVAGCGDSGTKASAPPPKTANGQAATVSVENAGLGECALHVVEIRPVGRRQITGRLEADGHIANTTPEPDPGIG